MPSSNPISLLRNKTLKHDKPFCFKENPFFPEFQFFFNHRKLNNGYIFSEILRWWLVLAALEEKGKQGTVSLFCNVYFYLYFFFFLFTVVLAMRWCAILYFLIYFLRILSTLNVKLIQLPPYIINILQKEDEVKSDNDKTLLVKARRAEIWQHRPNHVVTGRLAGVSL